jgi:hypothetical protein
MTSAVYGGVALEKQPTANIPLARDPDEVRSDPIHA